ncbi:uncharacterized protein BDR25DRAFT_352242 [Lindgomyces ingoldianus]|uniref:Uncharacterized protein n=1 Tax=Lindgomyces ingoldianus TaxID=673940 RepID=A0ACB6R3V6_9PLEO|nr:uncharacterized protein BDR25DRAFT_352242 [Lindgomyces ingoldianus]KAF2473747.1 hypothetical protein BDR25DRAFT_352242 [Lindgomyces ingoldianus]
MTTAKIISVKGLSSGIHSPNSTKSGQEVHCHIKLSSLRKLSQIRGLPSYPRWFIGESPYFDAITSREIFSSSLLVTMGFGELSLTRYRALMKFAFKLIGLFDTLPITHVIWRYSFTESKHTSARSDKARRFSNQTPFHTDLFTLIQTLRLQRLRRPYKLFHLSTLLSDEIISFSDNPLVLDVDLHVLSNGLICLRKFSKKACLAFLECSPDIFHQSWCRLRHGDGILCKFEEGYQLIFSFKVVEKATYEESFQKLEVPNGALQHSRCNGENFTRCSLSNGWKLPTLTTLERWFVCRKRRFIQVVGVAYSRVEPTASENMQSPMIIRTSQLGITKIMASRLFTKDPHVYPGYRSIIAISHSPSATRNGSNSDANLLRSKGMRTPGCSLITEIRRYIALDNDPSSLSWMQPPENGPHTSENCAETQANELSREINSIEGFM